MVKENSFITIQAFMVNELNLKGNELLIYAIIHGFSQDGESEFTGSLQYLADWTNSTKQGVMKALKSLMEKQLILKNETFQNNLKFCTYKVSQYETKFNGVLNKVERGYETKFNGGIKQSLPNNINNNIINNKEYNIPAYVPEPFKTDSNSFQTFLNDCFSMISEHNKKAKYKIPISKAIMYFSQKEGRDFLQLIKQGYSQEEIKSALQNYLKVANSDTWKSGFSFNAFCNKISEYTADYFDMSKYIDVPKNHENVKEITDAFAQKNRYEKWFDYAIFVHNREAWIKAGKPEGEEFDKWADKAYADDEKNGRLDTSGCYKE